MTVEDLLKQQPFLERLALELVGESSAADLVQQANLVALERSPTEVRSLRAWLHRVMRNLVAEHARSDQRRTARERALQAEAVQTATDETAARLEIQRHLVESVLSLREPYRTSVLLRYFQDLPARTIADRLGVPLRTVRTRLQRALDILRLDLDQRTGQHRSRWQRSVIAAGVPSPGLSIPGSVVPVGKWPALASLAVAMFVLVSGAWMLIAGDPRHHTVPPLNVEAGNGFHGRAGSPGETGAVSPGPAPVLAPGLPADETGPCCILGRVVDSVGRALEGVPVRVFSTDEDAWFGRNPVLEAASGADGSFRFEGLPYGYHRVSAQAQGTTRSQQGAQTLPGTEHSAMMVLTLHDARLLVGVVRDDTGAPVADARVLAYNHNGLGWQRPEAVTDSQGRFRLAGLPLDSVHLSVWSQEHEALFRGPVDADVVGLELILKHGLGAAIRIRAHEADGTPIAGARIRLRYKGLDPDPVLPWGTDRGTTDSDGLFEQHGLLGAPLEVSIHHEMYSFPRSPVLWAEPGKTTEHGVLGARRDGGVRLEGQLLDLDGTPLPAVEVMAARWRFGVQPVVASTDDHGEFQLDSPVAVGAQLSLWLGDGDHALVGADVRGGWLRTEVEAGRKLELQATRSARIEGRVLTAAGSPAPGIEVSVTGVSHDSGGQVAMARTDQEGSFVVSGLAPAPGGLGIEVADPVSPVRLADPVILEAGERVEGVTLSLHEPCSIGGVLVDEAGAPLAGHPMRRLTSFRFGRVHLTAADGSFLFGDLQPGEFELMVGDLQLGDPDPPRFPFRLEAGEQLRGVELVMPSPQASPTSLLIRATWEDGSPAGSYGFRVVQNGHTFSSFNPGSSAVLRLNLDEGGACEISGVSSRHPQPSPDGQIDRFWFSVAGPVRARTGTGEEVQLVFPIEAPGSITARVSALSGPPEQVEGFLHVSNAVKTPTGVRLAFKVFPDDAGRIDLRRVPPGSHVLELKVPGMQASRIRADVRPGRNTDLGPIALSSASPIRGRVVDRHGRPVREAQVSSRLPLPHRPVVALESAVLTDDQGFFEIAGPGPDTGALTAWKPGYAAHSLRLGVGQLEYEMVLTRSGTLQLINFPPAVSEQEGWRLHLEYLGSGNGDHTIWPEPVPRRQTHWRELEFPDLPMGSYDIVFWRQTSQDQRAPPTIPVPHEAYVWRVDLRAGETTLIDVGDRW